MGIEGGVAIGAAFAAGSVALLGFGLDSGIEAVASTSSSGGSLAPGSPVPPPSGAPSSSSRSVLLLAPYIAIDAILALVDR